MVIHQLSVFLENKDGTLSDVLNILADNEINIVAMTIADTEEFGMLRMIVSDPDKGRSVLREHGISAHLANVLAIRFSHDSGSLNKVINIFDEHFGIEYIYAFANGEDASAIIKISKLGERLELVEKLIRENNICVWTAEEAYHLNQK